MLPTGLTLQKTPAMTSTGEPLRNSRDTTHKRSKTNNVNIFQPTKTTISTTRNVLKPLVHPNNAGLLARTAYEDITSKSRFQPIRFDLSTNADKGATKPSEMPSLT